SRRVFQAENQEIAASRSERTDVVVVRLAEMIDVPGFTLEPGDAEELVVKRAVAGDDVVFLNQIVIARDGAIRRDTIENSRGFPGVLPFLFNMGILHDIAETDDEFDVVWQNTLANPHRLRDVGLGVLFAVELSIGKQNDREDLVAVRPLGL